MAGGNGYSAALSTGGIPTGAVKVPSPVTITSIKSGGIEIGGTPKQLSDLKTHFDPTKDTVIEWSCDGSATKGSGCDIAGFPAPHVVFAALTSGDKRATFGKTAALNANFGTLNCFAPHKTGTLTIKAAAMAELLGKPTPQSTGSIRLVIMNAGLKAFINAPPDHRHLHGAGAGDFAFINLP